MLEAPCRGQTWSGINTWAISARIPIKQVGLPSSLRSVAGPTKRVVAFYNHCVGSRRSSTSRKARTPESIVDPSCHVGQVSANNAVHRSSFTPWRYEVMTRLGNFMRTLALPKEVEHWSMTTLRDKLVKIGAKVVRHGRYVTFQLAEVAVPRDLFRKILSLIDDLRRRPAPA